MTRSPQHTANSSVSVLGALLIGTGVVAFVACVVGFALGWVSFGTWAGIVALLSSAAGLAYLTAEGRRQRRTLPMAQRPAGK
ncbi:MAG: hypothetical protein WBB07_22830 [Mycobacterium sp.]